MQDSSGFICLLQQRTVRAKADLQKLDIFLMASKVKFYTIKTQMFDFEGVKQHVL